MYTLVIHIFGLQPEPTLFEQAFPARLGPVLRAHMAPGAQPCTKLGVKTHARACGPSNADCPLSFVEDQEEADEEEDEEDLEDSTSDAQQAALIRAGSLPDPAGEPSKHAKSARATPY